MKVTVSPSAPEAFFGCVRIAKVPSGSTVSAGTALTLSCATPGAVIYYTLDGSCPCVESSSRRTYEGPIALTGDSYLIAYAVAPGLEDSRTAAFIYFTAAPGEAIRGKASADSHSVTAAVWVDLSGVTGRCDVVLAYYDGGRYLGMTTEPGIDATGLASISAAKRFVCAAALTDASVKVMVVRTGEWTPLLPAKTLEG